MTRFARAKGSKSSNEKAPEDGTPWEVMKEQLAQAKKESEESKKRQEAEKQRIDNYENFLKERKVQKRPATWCDFPETELKEKQENNTAQTGEQPAKKKKNKHKADNKITNNESHSVTIEPTKFETESTNKIKKKKNKTHNESTHVVCNGATGNISTNVKTVQSGNNKKEMNKQNDQITEPQLENDISQIEPKPVKKKKMKIPNSATNTNIEDNNSKSENANDNLNSEKEITTISKKQQKKNRNKAKKLAHALNNTSKPADVKQSKVDKTETSVVNKQNKIKGLKKKKESKLIDGQPVRRKEVTERSFQLIINGKDVELVRYDGFPIMKKDAERLEDLKNSMMKKGIPKSEVQRTMKLERRRAEKALARVKRDVCYNCRKGGHNLSDCPDLKSKIPREDAAEGVCFKCGSTEHRQFECKVQRDKEFRFATCFICKEPGHIARQCPDNPKGLYPNGGSCKLCGDVTHLRKDCPTVNVQKEQTSVKLQTLDSTDNIEDIGQQLKTTIVEESSKKPKKIKF